MGPRVAAFESAFAAFCGVRHSIAVANGTAALHLSLIALGCGEGDEVLVPSLNFVAAANCIVHVGARPVFCDVVGDDDLTVDPRDIEARLGPRTKAILVMHYGGFACRMDEINELARDRQIAVIEDAAHAPGSTYRGVSCGRLANVGCFSFFSNKNLPVGEGGMIVTDDDDLAGRLRLLRSHGMTTLTWDRHRGHAQDYDVVIPGFNYRMDELHAAIGLAQLSRLTAENEARRAIAARYRQRLDGRLGITMPFRAADPQASAHHLAVALLPSRVDRDGVRERLRRARIQTSLHYPPIHRFSYFADEAVRLPHTESVSQRLITLPLYGRLEEAQVDTVANALLDAVG